MLDRKFDLICKYQEMPRDVSRADDFQSVPILWFKYHIDMLICDVCSCGEVVFIQITICHGRLVKPTLVMEYLQQIMYVADSLSRFV
jgi:hypothetical protein